MSVVAALATLTKSGRPRVRFPVKLKPVADDEIEAHMGLVRHVLRRFSGHRCIDREDLVQAGRMGLWCAHSNFDPTRGHAFSSFAVRCIWGAMYRLVRDSQAKKHALLEFDGERVQLAHDRRAMEPADQAEFFEELRLLAGPLAELAADPAGANRQRQQDEERQRQDEERRQARQLQQRERPPAKPAPPRTPVDPSVRSLRAIAGWARRKAREAAQQSA